MSIPPILSLWLDSLDHIILLDVSNVSQRGNRKRMFLHTLDDGELEQKLPLPAHVTQKKKKQIRVEFRQPDFP